MTNFEKLSLGVYYIVPGKDETWNNIKRSFRILVEKVAILWNLFYNPINFTQPANILFYYRYAGGNEKFPGLYPIIFKNFQTFKLIGL